MLKLKRLVSSFKSIIGISFLGSVFVSNFALSNSCADRHVCRRIVLTRVGAGSERDDDGTPLNNFESQALGDVQTNLNAPDNKSLVFVFSNSTKLKKELDGAQITSAGRLHQLGASEESWDKFIHDVPSLIIEAVKNDKACMSLIKDSNPGYDQLSPKEKLKVISRYLSLELSNYAHSVGGDNGKHSIAMTEREPSKTTKVAANSVLGTKVNGIEEKKEEDLGYTTFENGNFEKLRDLFPESIIRNLTHTCNAAEVASKFVDQNGDACSCFIAASEGDLNSVSDKQKSPLVLHNFRASNGANRGVPVTGAENMLDLKDALWTPYLFEGDQTKQPYFSTDVGDKEGNDQRYGMLDTVYSFYGDKRGPENIPQNPLVGFAVTSADIMADGILNKLSKDEDISVAEAAGDLLKPRKGYKPEGLMSGVHDVAQKLADRQVRSDLSHSAYDSFKSQINADFLLFANCFAKGINGKANAEEMSPSGFFKKVNCGKMKERFDEILAELPGFIKQEPNDKDLKDLYAGMLRLKKSFESPPPMTDDFMSSFWKDFSNYRRGAGNEIFDDKEQRRIGTTEYDISIDSLNNTSHLFAKIQAVHNAVRSYDYKKDAYVSSYMKVHGARILLEQKIKSVNATKQDKTDLDKLTAQIDCLEQYGFGPTQFNYKGPAASPKIHANYNQEYSYKYYVQAR